MKKTTLISLFIGMIISGNVMAGPMYSKLVDHRTSNHFQNSQSKVMAGYGINMQGRQTNINLFAANAYEVKFDTAIKTVGNRL